MDQTKREILFFAVLIILGNIYFNGDSDVNLSPEGELSCGGASKVIDVSSGGEAVEGTGTGGDPTQLGAEAKAEADCVANINKKAVLGSFTCGTCPPGKSGCKQIIYDMSDVEPEEYETYCEVHPGKSSSGEEIWYAICDCTSGTIEGSANVKCGSCLPTPQPK
nr:hypothetical protein [archaeon]